MPNMIAKFNSQNYNSCAFQKITEVIWKCCSQKFRKSQWCCYFLVKFQANLQLTKKGHHNRHFPENFVKILNPLSANPTKWTNTLKQFVGKLPTNYLSVIGHFVGLALIVHLYSFVQLWATALKAHLEQCQTSKMRHFVKIVNDFQPLTIFTKKLHLRCLTEFWISLCSSDVISGNFVTNDTYGKN